MVDGRAYAIVVHPNYYRQRDLCATVTVVSDIDLLVGAEAKKKLAVDGNVYEVIERIADFELGE